MTPRNEGIHGPPFLISQGAVVDARLATGDRNQVVAIIERTQPKIAFDRVDDGRMPPWWKIHFVIFRQIDRQPDADLLHVA